MTSDQQPGMAHGGFTCTECWQRKPSVVKVDDEYWPCAECATKPRWPDSFPEKPCPLCGEFLSGHDEGGKCREPASDLRADSTPIHDVTNVENVNHRWDARKGGQTK